MQSGQTCGMAQTIQTLALAAEAVTEVKPWMKMEPVPSLGSGYESPPWQQHPLAPVPKQL